MVEKTGKHDVHVIINMFHQDVGSHHSFMQYMTSRYFVILNEIGRETSSHNSAAIAMATLQDFVD